MSARDNILKRLRAVTAPDIHPPEITARREVVPSADEDLLDRFVEEARKLNAVVQVATSEAEALQMLQDALGDAQHILSWDAAHIPVAGYGAWLDEHGIRQANADDYSVTVSVTGADAAIAATGSLVLGSGAGKPRSASLTTDRHIAILQRSQIVFNMEAWVRHQQADLDAFRDVANMVLISGASRTADIAMELVLGAHGPAELHIIIL